MWYKHGLSTDSFYKLFYGIKQRCNNPKTNKYKYYGGKGVLCLWDSFEQFKDDMYESYLEHCNMFGKNNTTINRIDGAGHYFKENCRWSTYKEQGNNLKNNRFFTYDGKTMCMYDWSKKIGISQPGLRYRLKKYNNNISDAINNPTPYKLN